MHQSISHLLHRYFKRVRYLRAMGCAFKERQFYIHASIGLDLVVPPAQNAKNVMG